MNLIYTGEKNVKRFLTFVLNQGILTGNGSKDRMKDQIYVNIP